VRRALPYALLLPGLLGVLLRATLQDHCPPILAYFYYCTPPIVLAVLASLAGAVWALRRCGRRAALMTALAGACLLWARQTMWMTHAAPAVLPANAQRVVFWNIARGAAGWPRLAAEIARQDADIVGLVEAGQDLEGMRALWNAALPGYHGVISHTGIALLARGEVTPISITTSEPWGRYIHARVRLADGDIDVVVFDLSHTVAHPRSVPLGDLYAELGRTPGTRLLVLGDFNTPADSAFLAPLRARCVHAFETAGRGYAASWPVPLPFLTIDQAWLGAGLRALDATLTSTPLSDHRRLALTIAPQ
jgi:vancomycin resistance protein VanJ